MAGQPAAPDLWRSSAGRGVIRWTNRNAKRHPGGGGAPVITSQRQALTIRKMDRTSGEIKRKAALTRCGSYVSTGG